MSDATDKFLRRLSSHGGIAIASSWMSLEEVAFAQTNLRESGDFLLIPGTNTAVVRCDTIPGALVMSGTGKSKAFQPALRQMRNLKKRI